MNHLKSLYQKYRPANFLEIKGQDLIIENLKKELSNDYPAQAYIFSGGRGTGKTTTARIFAKELGTDQSDLYEIDGATYTGVDQIREIIENTKTLPNLSRFKIYIIDEAHMLSKSAFNALLKTLEEPPKHTIFIMATTEPEKIPETIISRCQFYNFKEPDLNTLKEYLSEVAQKENLKFDEEAIYLLALLGRGSFRDSLSIMQKVILSANDNFLSGDLVSRTIGTPTKKIVLDFLDLLNQKNKDGFLELSIKLEKENRDPVILVALAIETLQNLLRSRFTNIKINLSEIENEWILANQGKSGENLNSNLLLDLINLHLNLEKVVFKYPYFEGYWLSKI